MSDTNIDILADNVIKPLTLKDRLIVLAANNYSSSPVAMFKAVGELETEIKQLIKEARIDELQRVIEQDGNVFVGNGENQIIWNARTRLAALQGEVE